MTRRMLLRRLFAIVAALSLLVASGFAAKFLGWEDAYEALSDFSVPIIAVFAALLAHYLQRRATFLSVLREQWAAMVSAKAELVRYCEAAQARTPDPDEYFAARAQFSRVIDEMRVVYRNVGETERLVGLYPFAPLHNMMIAFETLDPRRDPQGDHAAVWEVIWGSFNAVREHFLDEFAPPEPTRPVLIHKARRHKTPGASAAARGISRRQEAQLEAQNKQTPPQGTEA